ncbi:MAG: glycosyltransferase family 4 protein [Pirellulaceae bacterium]|nr:glycosyltransferase family 4 protein [Pirellulaceae bacterium]
MRLIFIHQFFAGPESPGPAQPRRLVRYLADRGHEVIVLAGDYNAYTEQTEPTESITTQQGGSVMVHRLKVPRQLRASMLNRLRSYGYFAWAAYRFGRSLPAADVVLASIQPLFSGMAARALARKFRCPFLLEVRDLWPDALVVRRLVTGYKAWILERMARSNYFSADRVVCLTPGLKTELLKKGVPAERIDLFPNAYDKHLYDLPPETRQQVRQQMGWGDQFVAVYTGTHTVVTAIDVIVRAANELKDRADIRIDLFGTGQTKQEAIELAAQLGLTNIHFHDAVPKKRVPEILAGADAGIMTLFQSPLIHIYFENKLIDYMAAGKPILAAMDGVQPILIERAGAGRVVHGLDHAGLSKLIRDTADNPANARAMGEAGYKFVSANVTQEIVLQHYAAVLEAMAQRKLHEVPVWDPLNL